VGDVPQLFMLGASFTAGIILERDGMLVSDSSADVRFRHLPHVIGEPHIRFYAGFPLESSDGSRIGTLNVFDSEPQLSYDSWDLLLLRQVGLMAQAEIHRGGDLRH
jgi:GAF domain-containing protein